MFETSPGHCVTSKFILWWAIWLNGCRPFNPIVRVMSSCAPSLGPAFTLAEDNDRPMKSTSSARLWRTSVVLMRAGISVALLLAATACGDGDESERGASATPSPSPTEAASHTTTDTASPPASAQTMSVPIKAELLKRARTEGHVSVIVTLNIPYRPEAELASPTEAGAQRTAIAAAQDEIVASVPGATVTTRMTVLPQIVFSVDEATLRQLATSPLVLAIDENSLSAPTS